MELVPCLTIDEKCIANAEYVIEGELKHVFLVDEDVDCFDLSDVIWAMNTRFQADVDLIPIADMVPAMILVMPISALWVNYIMPLVS